MPRPPPVMSITFMSAPAQEQLVEIRKRQLIPRRATVVAGARALGLLHLAQERVHLRVTQSAVRAHGSVAGHGGEELVLPGGEHLARAVLADFLQQAAGEADDVAIADERARG